MWRIFVIVVTLTLGVGLWLGYELGVVPGAVASEKPDAGTDKRAQFVQEKEKQNLQKENDLKRREAALVEKERLLGQQLGRYEKVIGELRSKVTALETSQNARVDNFRQVYEKMEAKKASKVLDGMEIGLASQIIGGMKNKQAAEILSAMSPERARQITEKFLGKRNLASKEVNEVTKDQSKGGEK